MYEKPKLSCTKNYDLFEMHEFNRPLHEDPVLLASMEKVGFMPSSPIQCVRNGAGRLKIVRGHHRLHYARHLNLPVWYVVDDTKVDLFDLEGGRQGWSLEDFAIGRARSGNADCAKVVEFQHAHGLTLGAAASLLAGESAGSGNHMRRLKDGTYRVAADLSHARSVVDVTDFCVAAGIAFARRAAFVIAISKCLRIPEFDPEIFKHRVKSNGAQMIARGTVDAFLTEIETLYNHGAKGNRLAVAFRAKEVSRARKENFGR